MGKRNFCLTPPPARPKKAVVKRKPSGKPCYGVSFQGKPFGITYTHQGEQRAIGNVLYRNRQLLEKQGFALTDARKLMTAVRLKNPDEWKGKLKAAKPKLLWQPLQNGRPIPDKPATRAVSAAKAADNAWFGMCRPDQGKATEEDKRIYHEEMSARPLFGQPRPHRPAARKASHARQESLFPH